MKLGRVILIAAVCAAAPAFAQEKPGAAEKPTPGKPPAEKSPAAEKAPPADKTPPTTMAPPAEKGSPPAESPKGKKAPLLDINTAAVADLKTLPGITDEIAAKIVAGRPYKGKDALLKQNLVDKDEYAKIRPLIIAKQPKKAPPAK